MDSGICPPIEDYALLSDCESTALVSRTGSIDWCCMPRMDADSCFGRLLDWYRSGYCSIAPADLRGAGLTRAYEDGTMVLATRFENAGGSVLLRDFFALGGDPGRHDATDHLCRIASCTAGAMVMRVAILPRFDFGAILPDLRKVGPCLYTACGSDQGLLIDCNVPLELRGEEALLRAEVTLRAGETIQLSIRFIAPEALEQAARTWTTDCGDLPAKLECTLSWWAAWEHGARRAPHPDPLTRRSALVLKALCFWEIRDAPRHFVHSKAMCWVAVNRGIRLAKRHGRSAPTGRWHAMRRTMRAEIDREGYDHGLGVYRQAYGETHADAALLLLPQFGYLPFDDPRMLRTAGWIARELDRHGLLLRYARPDGLAEPEGTFLACTFWLAECLAQQGRRADAQRAYDRAAGYANELGLFSEEFAADGNGMLGSFPQALTHLAQVTARLALDAIPQVR